jgi:hypothetical protein
MLPSPWILIAVGLAFAAVAGWGGYQHIRASDAVGERNVAIKEKQVAEAERDVAKADTARAVTANEKLQAANQELQELRERERKILAQVVSDLEAINEAVAGQTKAVNDLKESNADVKAYLDSVVPPDVRQLLDK